MRENTNIGAIGCEMREGTSIGAIDGGGLADPSFNADDS